MPVINLWGATEKEWIRPRCYLYYDGIEFNQTSCPLEVDVYRLAIHDRVLELARLSHSVPIAGVAIDLEMYGADMSSFPDYCLCDYCFERFLAGRAVSEPLLVNMRQDYLVRTGQVETYRSFTIDYIAKLTKKTKEQLEVIAPDFMIGVLLLDQPRSYARGLAKGLGGGPKAVLAFTEQTYQTGYSDYIKRAGKRFRDEKINAKLVVGIWQRKFPPEHLVEQYYHCAKDSAGYWIYTMESLSEHTKMRLPFEKEQYWEAIGEANKELQKLQVDSGYESTLQVRTFHAPPKALNTTSINIPCMQYVRIEGNQPGKPTDCKLIFRGRTTLVFVAEKEEELKFEVALRKFGENNFQSGYVALTSNLGDILVSSLADLQKSARLQTTAPYTGSYALVFDSDTNISQVVSYSHPFSAATQQRVHLVAPNQNLYFWKPPASSSAKVAFGVQGLGESVVVTFKNEAGKVLGVYDIVGERTITVPLVENRKGEIIELKIKPRPEAYFEDVWLKVEAGLEECISPFKNGLLRQKDK
ncbi:MAG: hypothetical protein ACYSSL_10665, partial [Planctomycetota bacterium]|jgi:hypothetical protein